MMYSAYKLNKQGDNIHPWRTPFPIWNQSVVPSPVLTVASWPAYRFLKRQVRWSGIPNSFRIFHSLHDKSNLVCTLESGHRGNLPQHSNSNIQQTNSKNHIQWWKPESISSKIKNKTRMSTLTTIIQHSFGSPTTAITEEIKGIQIGKEVKLSLNKQGDNIQPWRTPFPTWNQSVVPYPVLQVQCNP